MPHPLIPEDEEALSADQERQQQPTQTSALGDEDYVAQGELVSYLSYKDQADTYINFVNANPVQADGVPEEKGPPLSDGRPDPRRGTDGLMSPGTEFGAGAPAGYGATPAPDRHQTVYTETSDLTNPTDFISASPDTAKSTHPTTQMKDLPEEEGTSSCGQRRKMVFLGIGVIIVAIIIGISVGVAAGGGGGDDDGMDPQRLAPVKIWELTPQSFQDNVGDTEQGTSISLDSAGKRLAVTDREFVEVLEQGSAWLTVGSPIPPPANYTVSDRPPFIQDGVLIRAPVVVKLSGDGEALAVGYSTHEDNLGLVQVYRFYEDTNEWGEYGQLLEGHNAGDFFGATLDLSENGGVLTVGAPGNGGSLNVYIFNAGEWTQRGVVIVDEIGNLTITSVSISENGEIMAIGGVAGDDGIIARIFQFVVATGRWETMGKGIEGFGDGTGYMVALSGDGEVVAVSSYYLTEDNTSLDNESLDVRTFRYVEGTWVQLGGRLHAMTPGVKAGYFIDLSNDGYTMAMGDPGRSGQSVSGSESGTNQGHIHIYRYDEATADWFQQGPDIYGNESGDRLGYTVAVSGDGMRFAGSAPFSRSQGTIDPHGQVLLFGIPDLE